MLALMPQPSNSLPGLNYWYGSNSLPEPLDGVPQESSNSRMMRRASEAVVQTPAFQSQESSEWDGSQGQLHLDTTQATLFASGSAAPKAPLAPKQGLGGALANARGQHQSPITGNYTLRTPRGKITSIACEGCRKRKSKCDGVRPKCHTCESKGLKCVYDLGEDERRTTQLRAHNKRLTKDCDDYKSMFLPLVMAVDRPSAASWAAELQNHGFANYSAEEMRKALLDPSGPIPGLPDDEASGTPSSEHFAGSAQNVDASPYDTSSREESQEQIQPTLTYGPESVMEPIVPMNAPALNLEAAKIALDKMCYDCGYYRNMKRGFLEGGWTELEIFGIPELDVDSILLGKADPQDTQLVTTWCSRTVNKLLPATPLPVRLASTWIFTKMMRYLIWPTVENTNANPDWLMPAIGKQETSPYDILIDLIPWPQVRQLLYQHPKEYPVIRLVGLIGITWPYGDDACHYWDIEADCQRITPLFESTVADLNNWTIDPKALDLIPQLAGHIPVKPVR